MKAYRAAILRFAPEGDPNQSAVFDEDGLLVVGPNAQGRQLVLLMEREPGQPPVSKAQVSVRCC